MRVSSVIAGVFLAVIVIAVGKHGAAADSPNTKTPKKTQQSPPNNVVVQPGDTLYGIATAHQTTYVRLFDANSQITDPNLIFPSEVIRVPAADEQLPDRALPVASAPPASPAVTGSGNNQTAPQAQVTLNADTPAGSGVWQELAQCEASGNWAENSGNGYFGGLQFTLSSWQAVGGSGYPNQASPAEQISRAEALQAREGWSAWPACSAKLGL